MNAVERTQSFEKPKGCTAAAVAPPPPILASACAALQHQTSWDATLASDWILKSPSFQLLNTPPPPPTMRSKALCALVPLILLAAFFLPLLLFGTTKLDEPDRDEPSLVLGPGRQIFGLRLEYGKKLNVALTRMSLHTQYEVRLSYPASVPPPPPPPIPSPAAQALQRRMQSPAP